LNVTVKRVIWGKSQVRVLDQTDREYRAQAVVITVPLPMLQDDSISLEPEIPTLRHAARQLVMGHVTRMDLVVKERFWEKKGDGISFVYTPLRPFKVWWTQNPLQAPLITGWAGGPPAVELAKNGDVEGAAISELARAFGMRRSRVEALVDSIHTHDWTRDANIRGAYSYAAVGGSQAARVLARSFDDTIFLAGEATDSGSTGTVEGAIATGKRAAIKLLQRVRS
jgi:monoamine oxidase